MFSAKQYWLLPLVTLLAWVPSARAQSGRKVPPRPPAETSLVRIETTEVMLPLNAYDAYGHLVTDLTPKDLIVIEDGEARQITALRREPANIVLVLDLANELFSFKNGYSNRYTPRGERLKAIREAPLWKEREKHEYIPRPAARGFAENFVLGLADGDQLAIMQYSDRVQLVQDWTNDKAEAIRAIRWRYRVGLKSRYYDALVTASQKLSERPGRRVIVVLSDGLDSASRANRSQAREAVASSRASVFVVGWRKALHTAVYEEAMNYDLHDFEYESGFMGWVRKCHLNWIAISSGLTDLLARMDSVLETGALELEELANESGGDVIDPPDFEHLMNSPEVLLRLIGAQYSLRFLAERPFDPETKRYIEVVPARPGLTVRVRRSYDVSDRGVVLPHASTAR